MTSSFGSRLSVAASLPGFRRGRAHAVKVGFLAPLSGAVRAWGWPGLKGCEIWVERVNAQGGIRLANGPAQVELFAFDCTYSAGRALQGARKLVQDEGVELLLMLGGDTFPPVKELVTQARVLTSTLLPSDLSPDTEFLIAPSEVHPLYNVTGVEWLSERRPELRTAAICGPRDALGLPSIATYRAAFEAAGITLAREIFFEAATADVEAIVDSMLSVSPDIVCWSTSYEPFVHAFTEAAFRRGYKGQLLSCTCDRYPRLIARTSREFMEGFVFQFPDFDDPALAAAPIGFDRPKEFYAEFEQRFPGEWSAVSWEYVAVLDLWRSAVEAAGSTEAPAVLAAMKSGGEGRHAFGEAQWWGRELFGIDNALVGDWPVVVIGDGKARIAEFRSLPRWLARHGDRLKAHMRALGQLWDQRVAPRPLDSEKVPGPFVRMRGAER